MRTDTRNSSRGLAIALIAAIAIGLGFLGDFLITCMEKQSYPEGYAEYVTVYSEKYGIPEHLIYSVIRTESDFESGAVSRVGAIGLMQLLPDTFKWLTDDVLFEHMEVGMLYDPETNIRYGTYYLSFLYDRYGSWDLVLAAYNGGPGNVDKWLENSDYADGEGGLKKIPFKETRQFVRRVNQAWKKYDTLYS